MRFFPNSSGTRNFAMEEKATEVMNLLNALDFNGQNMSKLWIKWVEELTMQKRIYNLVTLEPINFRSLLIK